VSHAHSKLTHLWLEDPLLPAASQLIPPEVVVLRPAAPPQPPYANLAPAQAIVAAATVAYDARLMDAAPQLRLIARVGIGLDNVDVAAATARGIVVCTTPDGPTESAAEHTVALLLALAKRVKQGDAAMAAGQFGPREALFGSEAMGKTLGLIGLGRIGRRVAEICRLGLHMQIVAYDHSVTAEQAQQLGVSLADLETVIASADFLSLHVPLTPQTRHLMNHERLALMKPGAYLLNTARGPLIDADALLAAVNSGKLAGAGLDVFDPEPLPVDSPLRNHPRIIATPHIASGTMESFNRMETRALEQVLAFFRDEPVAHLVNPDALQLSR